MDIYNEELQKITSFTEENKELVESALGLIAISIMKVLNEFNIFEKNLTILIANYYKISYSKDLDFRVEVLDSGYLSYGQKIKILNTILEKKNFLPDKNSNVNRYLDSLRTLGDLRNNIVHSIYGIDPNRFDDDSMKMIIYANGRKIDKKDLLIVFSEFEKYNSESNMKLTTINDFLSKELSNE